MPFVTIELWEEIEGRKAKPNIHSSALLMLNYFIKSIFLVVIKPSAFKV
jgi:hypothetical protein